LDKVHYDYFDELKKCSNCDCIFFNEIKAKTYTDQKFIFYGESIKANLQQEDITIPVAICISCGKIHIPRTSFNGMNVMDRSVQLYSKLLETNSQQEQVAINALLCQSNNSNFKEIVHVEAESDSVPDTEHAALQSPKRNSAKQNNKK
jgi:hypothetical protein